MDMRGYKKKASLAGSPLVVRYLPCGVTIRAGVADIRLRRYRRFNVAREIAENTTFEA